MEKYWFYPLNKSLLSNVLFYWQLDNTLTNFYNSLLGGKTYRLLYLFPRKKSNIYYIVKQNHILTNVYKIKLSTNVYNTHMSKCAYYTYMRQITKLMDMLSLIIKKIIFNQNYWEPSLCPHEMGIDARWCQLFNDREHH